MIVNSILIDSGEYSIKSGFGGETRPSSIIRTVFGKSKCAVAFSPTKSKSVFIGTEALDKSSILNLSSPYSNGKLVNVREYERICDFIFDQELQIDPKEHPIMLTDKPNTDTKIREELTEMFMETFQVPAFNLIQPSLLALYSIGKTSGTVVDCGESLCTVMPVFESFALTHAMGSVHFGGFHISEYLRGVFEKAGKTLTQQQLEQLKHNQCFVSQDIENQAPSSFEYEGVVLTSEGYECAEPLFKSDGLPSTVAKTCELADPELKSVFHDTILFVGGTSCFNGFQGRMEKELARAIPDGQQYNIVFPESPSTAVWNGGAYLTSLATFSQMWISQQEYKEEGSNIVNIKCF